MDDFAADPSTTGLLTVGSFVTGSIEAAGDADWFGITLTAGTEYRFYVQGVDLNEGDRVGGTLPEPLLTVRDGSGNALASAQVNFSHNAVIDFFAPSSGKFFLDVSSAQAGVTGTYTLSAKPYVPVSQVADFMINTFWNPGVTQTDELGPRHFDHTNITVNISALNATEQILALAALRLYSDVSQLTFTTVTGAADITYSDAGSQVAEGGENLGDVANGHILRSHVHISSDFVTSANLDSFGFKLFLHETGHALGLGHPGPYNGGIPDYGIDNAFANDGLQWTVMTDMGWPGQDLVSRIVTPQMADIYAIQEMYGVNDATRTGDTVYGFHSTAGSMFDFASYSGQVAFTIYDSGGQDTLDVSGYSMPQTLDLRPGQFSSVDGAQDNIGIYLTTTIENAVGGSGSDAIQGNDAGNSIFAGAGDDSIAAGNGSNYLRGEDGNDTIAGGSGFDDINGNKGDDTIDGGSGGGDWLVGGQANDLITAHHSNDILYGNLGDDTLNGGDGSELIRGGKGDDLTVAGAGNDWISGDRGSDTMTGGAGADTFHSSSGAGLDVVTDFNSAEGDRVQLDAGTTYTASQSGADVIIDMHNGDELILKNVTLSGLPTTWLFIL